MLVVRRVSRVAAALVAAAACAGEEIAGPGPGPGPDGEVTPARIAVVTQPADLAQTGSPFTVQPVVQLQDSNGAAVAVAGVAVTASIASGPAAGQLTGAAGVSTGANGRATFAGLGITGPAGTYTLAFGSQGLTAAASSAIDLLPVNPFLPLTEFGPFSYFGRAGGLYPGGSNAMPTAHDSVGRARARAVVPRDVNGDPSASGKYVLLSMGMSNTTQEWCAANPGPCAAWTFTGQAAADASVNTATLVIANGAMGGQTAALWDEPDDLNYDRVRDDVLQPRGLTEAQVQVIWMKVANPFPGAGPGAGPLPVAGSDADSLLMRMGSIVRAAKIRYPNLQIVFASSRIYAGYATVELNPEPYAFESGFAVKWLIEAQITQMAGGAPDPRAGNLDYDTVAPWIGWGAYLWANGLTPRGDGLTWAVADLESDGTHPSTSGEQKVGAMLLSFFKTSPHASCWFLAGQVCP